MPERNNYGSPLSWGRQIAKTAIMQQAQLLNFFYD